MHPSNVQIRSLERAALAMNNFCETVRGKACFIKACTLNGMKVAGIPQDMNIFVAECLVQTKIRHHQTELGEIVLDAADATPEKLTKLKKLFDDACAANESRGALGKNLFIPLHAMPSAARF